MLALSMASVKSALPILVHVISTLPVEGSKTSNSFLSREGRNSPATSPLVIRSDGSERATGKSVTMSAISRKK